MTQVLISELFDLSYRCTDCVLDQLCDDITNLGFTVDNYDNLDTIITINFYNSNIYGSITIRRFGQYFTLMLRDKEIITSSNWGQILDAIMINYL